jgi:hypothetical protein
VSRSPQFQVDGESFPVFSPHELGEDESPIERDLREARLREAKAREAEKFRCPTCLEPGARARGGDRYHGPGLCDQPGGAA